MKALFVLFALVFSVCARAEGPHVVFEKPVEFTCQEITPLRDKIWLRFTVRGYELFGPVDMYLAAVEPTSDQQIASIAEVKKYEHYTAQGDVNVMKLILKEGAPSPRASLNLFMGEDVPGETGFYMVGNVKFDVPSNAAEPGQSPKRIIRNGEFGCKFVEKDF